MNKRDAVLSLLDKNQKPPYVPAAFFLHFDPAYHRGRPAVEKHLEYFHYTDMDFVKIQYENPFPHIPEIKRPEDWANMPLYSLEFYEGPLGVIKGLVEAARGEALIVMTLYSPFMCAGQTTSDETITRHIQENPEAVKRGMEVITESLMQYVKAAIRLGLDGFYTSTQGGESGRFDDPTLFNECIRPYDLALMDQINRSCHFNILHVCDYKLPYADLSPFWNYPGQVINASLDLTGGKTTPQEVEQMFRRPFMGGMERLGALSTGSPEDVRAEARRVLSSAPERFILGADCTVLNTAPWKNLRAAVSTAHEFQRD